MGGFGNGPVHAASCRELPFDRSSRRRLMAAVAEHRIELATDFPGVTALRRDRALADEITAFALAGVLWLYWRRVAASDLPRTTTQGQRA